MTLFPYTKVWVLSSCGNITARKDLEVALTRDCDQILSLLFIASFNCQ